MPSSASTRPVQRPVSSRDERQELFHCGPAFVPQLCLDRQRRRGEGEVVLIGAHEYGQPRKCQWRSRGGLFRIEQRHPAGDIEHDAVPIVSLRAVDSMSKRVRNHQYSAVWGFIGNQVWLRCHRRAGRASRFRGGRRRTERSCLTLGALAERIRALASFPWKPGGRHDFLNRVCMFDSCRGHLCHRDTEQRERSDQEALPPSWHRRHAGRRRSAPETVLATVSRGVYAEAVANDAMSPPCSHCFRITVPAASGRSFHSARPQRTR